MKIVKNARKTYKARKDIFKDANKKLRDSIKANEWHKSSPFIDKSFVLHCWLSAGLHKQDFYRIGTEKALNMLRNANLLSLV